MLSVNIDRQKCFLIGENNFLHLLWERSPYSDPLITNISLKLFFWEWCWAVDNKTRFLNQQDMRTEFFSVLHTHLLVRTDPISTLILRIAFKNLFLCVFYFIYLYTLLRQLGAWTFLHGLFCDQEHRGICKTWSCNQVTSTQNRMNCTQMSL